MSMFATPAAPGGGIAFKDHIGALLLIEPSSLEEKIQTSFGPTDAVKADVHVIDGPGAVETFDDCLIFPKLLVSQTKSQIGKKVLGRLGHGTAKPGQDPPYLLEEASPEDITKAEAWVKQNAEPTVTSAEAPF